MSAQRGWPAPAKLNLFLHITGRRADGYHLLQTVFQFLDHADELTFSPRADGALRLVGECAGIRPEENLVMRAARLLQRRSGVAAGADIALTKRLPLGGGLGGGSSDAATALVALNRLWGVDWPEERLAALGLELGADVPVFVRGRAAWAEGVGEVLRPIEPPEVWYVVIVPPVALSTAALFADPELTRDCPPITIADFLSGKGRNVFEPVVRRRAPEVAAALEWLGGFAPARLTGTGACVFAGFATESGAREVLRRLPPPWSGFVARGMNRSPLLDRLAA